MRCQPAITICRLPSVYQSHCCHNNVSALPQSVCTTSAHCLHGLQGSMSDSAKWTHSYTCINKLLQYWKWMVQNRCHLPNNFGSCWIFPIPQNEPEMPLSKLPLPLGGGYRPLPNTLFFAPTWLSHQKWHLDWFSRYSTAHGCDKQTDRPTTEHR